MDIYLAGNTPKAKAQLVLNSIGGGGGEYGFIFSRASAMEGNGVV